MWGNELPGGGLHILSTFLVFLCDELIWNSSNRIEAILAGNALTPELQNLFTMNADDAGGTESCLRWSLTVFSLFFFLFFFASGLLYAECFKRPESLHADFWNSILLNTWNELSWFLDRRNGRALRRRVSGVVLISNCILVHQSAHRAEL